MRTNESLLSSEYFQKKPGKENIIFTLLLVVLFFCFFCSPQARILGCLCFYLTRPTALRAKISIKNIETFTSGSQQQLFSKTGLYSTRSEELLINYYFSW